MIADETNADVLMAELREDHWKMAILFQRLSEGLADGLDQAILMRILEALLLLFNEHSRREEAHLALTKNPGLAQHKKEHQLGVSVIGSVVAAAKLGRPLVRSDLDAISALFTEVLFAADGRDMAALAKSVVG